MEISSTHKEKDRISELPDDILVDCLSLLDMKNAAETSILSTRWRYLWTHLTNLDFDPDLMYPEESDTFWQIEAYETRKYFACINQVVRAHQGPCIDKFRVHSRYVSSYASQVDEWVKFALSKCVKELVLEFIGINLICADRSEKGYPLLGFDVLSRHPLCFTGITALQSLRLQYVNVGSDFLEFLLSQCNHLQRLYLDTIPLSSFKVKSSKLKYLSIVMRFHDLEELEIDAENLLYFVYQDDRDEIGGPHMLFKNLPMLVDAHFRGGLCRPPYPIFEKLSVLSNQLCKLSLEIESLYQSFLPDSPPGSKLVIPEGVVPCFPNVKHFILSSVCELYSCVLSVKRFIEACPILEVFKLQVSYFYQKGRRTEASELQEINLEDEKENVDTEKNEIDVIENMKEKKQSHPNLRILEIVGFLGASADIRLALDVASYACSLETIVCDTKGITYSGTSDPFESDAMKDYDVAKRRARKLAKIVSPKVKVLII